MNVCARRSGFVVSVLFLALLAPGCSGVSKLSGPSRPALSAHEQGLVRSQVTAALEERRFADAWNQTVEAGGARDDLESIALATLDAESGDAEDMFAELRTKWGALTPGSIQRVDDLIRDRMTGGRWDQAVEFALLTADDAPTYSRAFRIYEQAPARRAAGILEQIQDARADAAAPK